MVRTRLQARLLNLYGSGESSAYSTDSEVSFGTTWLDAAFLGRRAQPDLPTDPETDSSTHDMADNRHERRIQLLESAVMGTTEKFDELLTSINPQPDTRHNDSPRHRQPSLHGAGQPAGVRIRGRRYEEERPPHLDHRAPQFSEHVADQLRREEFEVPRHEEGKSLAPNLYIKTLIPKP